MLYNHFTEKLIGLQGVKVTKAEEREEKRREEKTMLCVQRKREAPICPCCGFETDITHDYRSQQIKEIPAFGKEVIQ